MTMKPLRWLLSGVLALSLAACGGGGGGDSLYGGGNGGSGCSSAASAASPACATVSSIDVVASTVQVGTGGDTVTVSAIVKGAGNVALSGVAVVFSATSGNLTNASVTTSAAGVATVTFAPGADRANRTATITAKAGSKTGSIDLQVTGTQLAYSGPSTVALGGTATLSITATDSKNAVVPNLPITVASKLNNGLSATSVTTDSTGTATVTYTATNPGSDEVTFTGAGASRVAAIAISSSQFAFVSPAAGTSVPVNTARAVTVRYLVSGAPQAGVTVNFSTTAGTVTPNSVVTNAAGEATVAVAASTAGPGTVQATVAGGAAQVSLQLNFVSLAPRFLVLQASPTAIGPNASGSTANQSQVRATVTDLNGNPVSNVIVSFTRLTDPSGGNLSQASAVTDASGQATVQYVAGTASTADSGVKLRASVLTDTSVFGDASLTVTQSALFIALGTGNTITNVDAQTYQKDWVVYVTDANGVAVANKAVTIKVLPTQYRKGTLVFGSGSWGYNPSTLQTCANEDLNYNGVLDAGEDFNGSGNLQPGNVVLVTTAGSAAAATGIATTDSTGRATISLLYAESYVPWVRVKLVAQATVSGTESSTEAQFWIAGAASDFNSATNPPAGTVSPFGDGSNPCSVAN